MTTTVQAPIDSASPLQHPGDAHEVPDYQPHTQAALDLKSRIAQHYDIASTYYHRLWGQHIHHGLFTDEITTKDAAQVNLIEHLVSVSGLNSRPSARVLDIGCGIGGTGRFLAKTHSASVTGITISSEQVKIAQKITSDENASSTTPTSKNNETDKQSPFLPCGSGKVRFIHLDAEKALEFFTENQQQAGHQQPSTEPFEIVWISECLSHIPNPARIFSTSYALLASSQTNTSKLVIADWFRAENLTPAQFEADIKPIEDGMLLPALKTVSQYVSMAEDAGFKVFAGPEDLSERVKKTWDISWSLVSSPSLWAFAIAQGRDGLAFLQSFRAMRRGYANGTFRYAVMVFEKV